MHCLGFVHWRGPSAWRQPVHKQSQWGVQMGMQWMPAGVRLTAMQLLRTDDLSLETKLLDVVSILRLCHPVSPNPWVCLPPPYI
jgi:hypothetical protein